MKIELIAAWDFAGAALDRTRGCFTSYETFAPLVEWVFREDKARYSEILVGQGISNGIVRHTLVMELPAGSDTRRAVSGLEVFSDQGIVALVTVASGERLLVGYSDRFGTGYPLHVAKAEYSSGSTPADFPAITLTLESTDADRSLPIE